MTLLIADGNNIARFGRFPKKSKFKGRVKNLGMLINYCKNRGIKLITDVINTPPYNNWLIMLELVSFSTPLPLKGISVPQSVKKKNTQNEYFAIFR